MRRTSGFDLTAEGYEGAIQYIAFFSLVDFWTLVICEIYGFPGSPDAVHWGSHCRLVLFYPCVLDCEDV